MAEIELFQFAGSHFNEKARWGLDLKRVPHERTTLMPGPHMRTMKKLTGATQTPALVDRGEVVPGSTAILEHLEQRFPVPRSFRSPPPSANGPSRSCVGGTSRSDRRSASRSSSR